MKTRPCGSSYRVNSSNISIFTIGRGIYDIRCRSEARTIDRRRVFTQNTRVIRTREFCVLRFFMPYKVEDIVAFSMEPGLSLIVLPPRILKGARAQMIAPDFACVKLAIRC